MIQIYPFNFFLYLAKTKTSWCYSNFRGAELDVISAGKYVKTACVVSQEALTPNDTYIRCQNAGGHFFVVDSADTQTTLLQILTSVYGASGGDAIWIDGRRDLTDNQWYSLSYGKTPLFAGLAWDVNGSNTPPIKDCLFATNRPGQFKFGAGPCNLMKYFVCEFTK